ncbi:NADPH:quinone reductase [Streptomyces sp. CB03234]|uniref:zinc-binding dehydrogenase n=1 Tax=Streptomyces sp. (strain CB03234) TaxID=1703937 RepID=UPI00093B1D66|nr:zinc-binding dehydrogenase [Streptomyces sp. CB03234]OKJ99411.1 NADPH:quinone reductase [Streptomyces sp. CB03234]
MRVAQVRAFGGPEVLVPADVPEPVAGPGQVLVEVAAVDTIFLETQLRSGWGGEYFTLQPPYVPGGGIAGTVRAVGAGVDGAAWLGRRVVASIGHTGGYAERAVADAGSVVPLPDRLAFTEAAALVHDGVTATALLEATEPKPGETVLVVGASGGMGTLLVQLAKAAGARVVGTARGERKTALVRELGADAVVDTDAPDWVRHARDALGPAGADVVLDGVGGQPGLAAFGLVVDGGRFSAHGAPTGGFAAVDPGEAERRGVRLLGIGDVQLPPEAYARLADRALAEAAAGRLRPVIGGTFPLDRAAEAHAAIENRSLLGKVVLTV